MNQAYLLIGSNIERRKNYLEALRRLADLGRIIAVSSVYETEPIGATGGDKFYNGAVLLDTELDAPRLKTALRQIEADLGRVRSADPNAPRPIDLDIALFNLELIRDAEMEIPDPLILQRGFVAQSLSEINPAYVHPVSGLTLVEIARRLRSPSPVFRRVPEMTSSAIRVVRPKMSERLSNAH